MSYSSVFKFDCPISSNANLTGCHYFINAVSAKCSLMSDLPLNMDNSDNTQGRQLLRWRKNKHFLENSKGISILVLTLYVHYYVGFWGKSTSKKKCNKDSGDMTCSRPKNDCLKDIFVPTSLEVSSVFLNLVSITSFLTFSAEVKVINSKTILNVLLEVKNAH